ncbi:GNAT family N-acetyltransferase [Oxalobacter sp. OttesenSCG-928-P03]|nr:GNAT family N-acetyltransferase [Oxalobacter sp. OttesenSCG-928-P03]
MTRKNAPARLETERLVLRQWKRQDYAPYAELNADRVVMAFFTATLNRKESDTMLRYLHAVMARRGWGIWAVERKEDGAFIGSVGLHIPRAKLPFSPCVEVGWRLAQAYWGQGYATEAARASLRYGFEVLDLPEIVSFTTVLNTRSEAVMRRLGMKTDPKENFEHPDVPKASPLREHCLYRITRQEWMAKNPA